MHRLLARLALLALLGVLSSGVAYGLDPNRTLTQYVHRIWQLQQGLPQAGIYAILQTGVIWPPDSRIDPDLPQIARPARALMPDGSSPQRLDRARDLVY